MIYDQFGPALQAGRPVVNHVFPLADANAAHVIRGVEWMALDVVRCSGEMEAEPLEQHHRNVDSPRARCRDAIA